jgi:subtilisin family serine protease
MEVEMMSLARVIIYFEEGDTQRRKQVEKIVSKVLASYPNSILAEVDDDQLKSLKNKGMKFELQEGKRMIRLRSVEFDTSRESPALPPKFQLKTAVAERDGRGYWIVQFIGPAKPEWGEKLTSLGANMKGYIPENAYLVEMSAGIKEKAEQLPFVSWIGVYEPAYKISPHLTGRKQKFSSKDLKTLSFSAREFQPGPKGNIKILLHNPNDSKKVALAVENLGGKVVVTAKDVIRASIDLDAVDKVAMMTEVKWIEPYVEPKLANDVADGIIMVEQVRNDHGLDGDGQIVAVADTGLDTGVNDASMHDDFEGHIIQIYDRVGDGANDVNSGHGTHVAGSILGNGSCSNGAIRGMAYAARLIFQSLERNSNKSLDGIPADLNTLFQQAIDTPDPADPTKKVPVRIHSNSWGTPYLGEYNTDSHNIDEFIWNHKDMAILFAAGNEGRDANSNGIVDTDSILAEACAKNCITVGASENVRTDITETYGDWWPGDYPVNPLHDDSMSDRADGMVAFSGRGPTDDGRIKPDIVAPGTFILSVRSSVASGDGWGRLPAADPNYPFYMYMGGTSMATPITAGTVALIRQYLVNACLHATPSAALLKAFLIHGAQPMAGQYDAAHSDVGPVPDNSQGWGRVNLQRSLFPVYPERVEFRDDPAVILGTGEQHDYTFSVVNTTVPFRATLVWTDYPSEVSAGGGLVNTLRVSIIPPAGTEVVGAPANNNVQQAVIPNPQAGTYTVRVRGVNINTQTMAGVNKKQDFALVVSGGLDFVEMYIKDNAADTGIAPSTGVMCLSPDIWISLTDDPALPPISSPEYGQTNFVFVKVHNRGSKAAANAVVKLYWANPGTNLSRPYWKTDGIKVDGAIGNSRQVNVPARTAGGDGEAITDAFEWTPPDPTENVVEPGHFCLFATVNHPEDPLLQEEVDRVRWEDNLAWKNVVEQDLLANSTTSLQFYVAGIEGAKSIADLHIDRAGLPASGSIKLKIPCRYLQDSTIVGLKKIWESPAQKSCQVEVTSGTTADLHGVTLKPSENTLVMLEVTLPKNAADGEVYPVFVEQRTNGTITGRVTLAARTVATSAYIANMNSWEIHLSDCVWAKKISGRNKVPYSDLDLAIKRGYNGCRYCLPKYSTD